MRVLQWTLALGFVAACASSDPAPVASTASRLTGASEVERATGVPVAVEWDFAPTWKGAFSSSTTLPAHLSNTTPTTQSVHLYVTASGLDQRTVRKSLGTFSIPAGTIDAPGTTAVNVSVLNLPVQSVGFQSEGELEAVWNENLSNQLTATSSGFFYSWDSIFSTITSYAYDGTDFTQTSSNTGLAELADIQDSAAGALSAVGRYVNASGGWTSVNISTPPTGTDKTLQTYVANGKRVFDLIAADEFDNMPVAYTTPQTGPNTYVLCATWHVQFEDANSYYTNFVSTQPLTDYPAAYSRYWISFKLGSTYHYVAKGYLDANGCTMSVPLAPNTPYMLWQETVVKNSETPQIDVFYGGWNPKWSAWQANPWALTCTFNCVQSGDLLGTGVTVNAGSTTQTKTVKTTTFGLASNGAAVVGAALRTPGLVSGLSGFTPHMKVFVNLKNADGSETGNYNQQPDNPTDNNYGVWLSPANGKPHNARWETIIAHEFGHYVNHLKSGLSSFVTGISTPNAACRCDQVTDPEAKSHCLQGAIENGFATNEGFAHFIAAQTLQPLVHTSCNFGYYKEFREDNATIDPPPVIKSCSSTVKWGQNHSCTDSSTAVEWDWLGALWSVRSDPTTPWTMDYFFVVWREACGNPSARCTGSLALSPTIIRSAANTHFGAFSAEAQTLNTDFTANGI